MNETKRKPIVIIGAGPAGIACAYELTKNGYPVILCEASDTVGGMSRSITLWGRKVDLGPHRFFSKQPEVLGFFQEILKDDIRKVNRKTRIYYREKFFNYPLKIGDLLTGLSLTESLKISWFYFMERLKPKKTPTNFEEWVIQRFGKKLYEIFFKTYSEKLWGLPCTEIDTDWAAQRIKNLSLLQAVMAAFLPNIKRKHKSLTDSFFYPVGGTGTLYEKAATEIIKRGGEILLNTFVNKVNLSADFTKVESVEISNGSRIETDIIVSTMPITSLIRSITSMGNLAFDAAANLSFRNTILVYLEVDHANLFPDNWIYVHSKKVKHGRITNFNNWGNDTIVPFKTTILCLEFWCFATETIWSYSNSDLAKMAIGELEALKLIPNNATVLNNHVVKIPKCYPIYKTNYKNHLKIISDSVDKINGLYPIGRYGSFKYNNQDHSILMGLLLARKIVFKKPINLWEVNSDSEYQE